MPIHWLLMISLASALVDGKKTTVIVTFMDDLPVSVGSNDSDVATPQVAPEVAGVDLVANLPLLGEAIYRGTNDSQDADDICDLLMTAVNIETCEPDSQGGIDQTSNPNDPAYPGQTYLNTTGIGTLWQQNIFGNKKVRIGIIDTGVDLTNPDILPSLWTNPSEQPNGKDNDGDGVPEDVHCASFLNGVASGDCTDGNSHGTWVTGAIGAVTNNNFAIAGGVQLPTLLPCKYMDISGNGMISDALLCFNWLASKNVQVISCSWGITTASSGLQQALSKLSASGILISVSSGNDGINTDNSPHFPSSFSSTMSAVVSVAALDSTGALWSRSNYGTSSVQLAAPGVSLIGLGLANTTSIKTGSSMVTILPLLIALLLPLIEACAAQWRDSNNVRCVHAPPGSHSLRFECTWWYSKFEAAN